PRRHRAAAAHGRLGQGRGRRQDHWQRLRNAARSGRRRQGDDGRQVVSTRTNDKTSRLERAMSIMETKDEDLLKRHEAAEADPVTSSCAKPAGVNAGKGFVSLGRKDIVRGAVQVVKKHGGENNLHYHTTSASFWMVLKGRVRFYGPGDVVIGEFGPNEGTI